jgi:hypothetical protein
MIEADTIGERMAYVFQGLTDDGKTYVLAIAPVRAKQPLEPFPVPRSESYEQTMARYKSYEQRITATIRATPEAEFTPDLAAVRTWLTTIKVK